MFREATPNDIAPLVDLINRAYRVEGSIVFGERTSESDVRDRMAAPGSAFLVLEDVSSDDTLPRLVGAVYVKVNGERGHFGPLAVDPESQGKGIGKALVAAVESYCRERGCVWVDLDVVNLREELPGFYESLGYAVTGTAPFPRPERLRREAHLVLMTKRIDEPVTNLPSVR